ncbi:protein kinase domain-containing protein [Nocardiopsis salina]|uniref:protein kinase domain-containing protein n=1 Tax=Nocardiopsis salina TaxID=245836 RepID=UPI0004767CB9|nr:serine/threonine protein kinase [Nocardiopsis salina]
MGTPDPDENAPTRRFGPSPPTTRIPARTAATRWVTRVFRPGTRGGGGEEATTVVPPGGTENPPGGNEDATTVVPPGGGDDRTDVIAPGSDRTSVLPGAGTGAGHAPRTAQAPARRPSGGGPGGGPEHRWWQKLLGPFLTWFAHLVSRVVVGPASDLDYAVPAELRKRYQILDRIGSGGEAVVYLAEPVDEPGRRLALKVYRPGHDINRELLDRLRARGTSSPHTPAIQGYGSATSSWGEDLAWEAQEYFDRGSLREVIDRAPLQEEQARAVVAAVAECLHHWQYELQHNHTDVKPENLLVRSMDPPVLALTDFGGAVRATMSRVYGGVAVTEDYAAPEVVEGRREAPAAWWSLGVMAHELVAGRRPERGGNWLTARNTEVDISAITDERWRLVARGLLTPAPAARWGHDEVAAWLSGERPNIRTVRRQRPISFAGTNHEDPPSLAFDLLDRSETGAMWLRTHWEELRAWLDREVNDYTFDRAYLTGLSTYPESAHVAISALAARYVPGMPPRFRGHEISADGLLTLASGDASRHAVVREAVESGAVGLGSQHWCPHPECRSGGSGRCALLEQVQHQVPLVMRRVRETVDHAVGGGTDAPQRPEQHEFDTAWARAVELVLDPEVASGHRSLLRRQSWHPSQRSTAPHAPWWAEQRRLALRDSGDPVPTRAAVVASLLLMPEAVRVGAQIQERERADGRARRQDRWAALAGSARERWAGAKNGLSEARQRRAEAATAPERNDGTTVDPTQEPTSGKERRRLAREERRRKKAGRQVERTMHQIERAQSAGRCRKFATPAAVLGLVDGLGRALRPGNGFFPDSEPIVNAYTGLLDLSNSALVSWLAQISGAVTGVLPGGAGAAWWLPVALSLALLWMVRVAGRYTAKARSRLAAYRMAAVGSALMLVVLLSSGLVALGSGVLIPLDGLLG